MFSFFEKQSFLVILFVSGLFLIFLSLFHIADITKLQVAPRAVVLSIPFSMGAALALLSLFFYAQDRLTLGWFKSASVRKIDGHLRAECSRSKITISFGKLQEVAAATPEAMVVLPANEYFDDDCIFDQKSALGAYIQTVFPDQTVDIQELIQAELACFESKTVEKESGLTQESYGIGRGVFLKEPLQSEQPVMFLSVTTKRAGEGLRAEMSYIFDAVREMQRVAADHRIDCVYVPVMGTGHGGLRNEVGLLALVLAICDGVGKTAGHHIKEYHIVVYRSAPGDRPSISERNARRILKTAIGLFS